MSTLIELAKAGHIEVFEPHLGIRQQPLRLLYARPKVWSWIAKNLADAESEYGSEISPLEQLDELLTAFCAGEKLAFERQIHPLHHWSMGIWELKTMEIRLFGWFPRMDVFLGAEIDFATRVKVHGLYPGYRNQAMAFRNSLNLDPPKFLPGADPNGVATNIS